jgi:hypothetical protein
MSAVCGNHCFGGDAWRNSNEDCKLECNQQKEEKKRERKKGRKRAIQATLVIGGEMGEHERELHGGESLKLKLKTKKQQSAQSSDSDDHKPPPW